MILIAICGEIGYRVGKSAKASLGESPFAVLQAAVFGLLALLLAFSFSVGLSRYDARRIQILREAESIRATILRAQMLDGGAALTMRRYLQRYVEARIAFASAGVDERLQADATRRSAGLQAAMWRLGVAQTALHGRSPWVQLFFMQALNDSIDQSNEQAAVLAAHVPEAVTIVLIVVVAFGSILLGIGFGRTERRGILAIALFAITLSLIVATIMDLDRPRRGFIRVSLVPLQSVQEMFVETSGSNAPPTGHTVA